MTRTRVILAVLLAAAALSMAAAVPAAAHPTAAHRSCSWSTSYWTKNGPPGAAQVTIASMSPLRCEYYRVTIQSTAFPIPRYHSGWLGSTGPSYVDTCQMSTDCSTLNAAWEDRETAAQHSAGSTSWQCRGLTPLGSWVPCSKD